MELCFWVGNPLPFPSLPLALLSPVPLPLVSPPFPFELFGGGGLGGNFEAVPLLLSQRDPALPEMTEVQKPDQRFPCSALPLWSATS